MRILKQVRSPQFCRPLDEMMQQGSSETFVLIIIIKAEAIITMVTMVTA
jgi:hypothetical protein